MTAAELVRSRLLALTDVTDLVSTRIYTTLAKAGAGYPHIIVRDIDDFEGSHLRGADGVIRARVQVDAAMTTKTGQDAKTVCGNVLAACDGPGDGTGLAAFAGSAGGSPGVAVLAIMRGTGAPDRFDGDEQEVLLTGRDYHVTYRRH